MRGRNPKSIVVYKNYFDEFLEKSSKHIWKIMYISAVYMNRMTKKYEEDIYSSITGGNEDYIYFKEDEIFTIFEFDLPCHSSYFVGYPGKGFGSLGRIPFKLGELISIKNKG